MNGQTDALQGQVEAITLVLTAIIQNLSPVDRARAALNLKIAHESEKQVDQTHAKSETQIAERDAIVEAYLGLLRG